MMIRIALAATMACATTAGAAPSRPNGPVDSRERACYADGEAQTVLTGAGYASLYLMLGDNWEVFEFWTTADREEWVMLMHREDGRACLIGSGVMKETEE